MTTHLWLRAESKPAEQRTVLTPQYAQRLVNAGYELTVEQSSQSVFPAEEYRSVGCKIVPEHSWINNAPSDAIILGLKELETSNTPLIHKHIHFAHVYKNQSGWEQVLNRFSSGGGTLYDLEFLTDDNGRRVAAFGYWAGYTGAALALLAWANKSNNRSPVLSRVTPRPNQQALEAEVSNSVASTGKKPVVHVIGALGRCGGGAIDLCASVGTEVIKWDLDETKDGGPFKEILAADVFLNCVFIETSMPPFLTRELIKRDSRQLSVICDVSCDPYGDYNPLPIYKQCTTFDEPIATIVSGSNPLYLIAIDHLPTLLPRESSEDFCEQLMPHLLRLDNLENGVWKRACELFHKKTALIETG